MNNKGGRKNDTETTPYQATKLQKNLCKLMAEHKISVHALHRKTGIPTTSIHRMRSDQDISPTISTLKPIADFFSLTLNQLIGDDPLPHEKRPGIYFKKRDNWIDVPIIGWQQAAHWPAHERHITRTVSTDIPVGEDAFALTVLNDDWTGLQKGAILIVDPHVPPHHRHYVVVQKNGLTTATLKQYRLHDGTPYLVSLNLLFKTVDPQEAYRILGAVVQIRLDFQSEPSQT